MRVGVIGSSGIRNGKISYAPPAAGDIPNFPFAGVYFACSGNVMDAAMRERRSQTEEWMIDEGTTGIRQAGVRCRYKCRLVCERSEGRRTCTTTGDVYARFQRSAAAGAGGTSASTSSCSYCWTGAKGFSDPNSSNDAPWFSIWS